MLFKYVYLLLLGFEAEVHEPHCDGLDEEMLFDTEAPYVAVFLSHPGEQLGISVDSGYVDLAERLAGFASVDAEF